MVAFNVFPTNPAATTAPVPPVFTEDTLGLKYCTGKVSVMVQSNALAALAPEAVLLITSVNVTVSPPAAVVGLTLLSTESCGSAT